LSNERKIDEWILITFGKEAYDYVVNLKAELPLTKRMYYSNAEDSFQEYDLQTLISKVIQNSIYEKGKNPVNGSFPC